MTRLMAIVVGLAALLLAGCAGLPGAPKPTPARLQLTPAARVPARLAELISLRLGEQVFIADASMDLRFVGVPQDSRCPVNATCAVPGEALVELAVTVGTEPAQRLSLRFPSSSGASQTSIAGYTINLEFVFPERRSEAALPLDRYTIAVIVRPSTP